MPSATSRIALVITTYNYPWALGLCLESLLHQTTNEFDIFIADDGSTEDTRKKIEGFKARFRDRQIQLEHVWHDDDGYRKSTINNEVFRRIISAKVGESGGYDVILCVDGDTFQHPAFVADHREIHERERASGHTRVLFMGRRTDLSPALTEALSELNVAQFARGLSLRLVLSTLKGETERGLRALRVVTPFVRKILKMDRVPDLLGSNYSISTALMQSVNGYDEDYKAYWGEDGDLFVRVRNSGARIVGAKYFAVQFHLWHKRREPSKVYQDRYEHLLRDPDYRRCANGIERSGAGPK